jgi:hypothetical protein
MSFATHPSADATSKPEQLIEWSTSEIVDIRRNIAKNPNTPKDVLIKYAYGEPDIKVLIALHSNFKCDSDIVFGLICNPRTKESREFINYLGYTRNLNEKTSCLLFDKGCRVLNIAYQLDVNRLKQWRTEDKSDRQTFFNNMISDKNKELMKLWIDD